MRMTRARVAGAGLAACLVIAAGVVLAVPRRPAAAGRGALPAAGAPAQGVAAFGALQGGAQKALRVAGAAALPQARPAAATSAAATSAAAAPSAAASGGATSLGVPAVRRVEESATLTVRVQNVASAFTDLTALASGVGGYVQSSDLQSGAGSAPGAASASATLVVAVPHAEYADFLQQAGGLGKVLGSSASGQDVTQQYVDLQGRLTALKAERQSYLTLLGKATSIGDILQIQSALTGVESQIEELTGEINVLGALTAMATVTVHLVPPAAAAPAPHRPPTPVQRVAAAFSRSLHALVGGATDLGLALAWIVPWAALAAAGVFAVRRLMRRGAGA